MSKSNQITKKRFVLANSLLGKGLTIKFTNKKDETYTYNHDEVFASNQTRLMSINCFVKYGNYTNTNKIPNWAK